MAITVKTSGTFFTARDSLVDTYKQGFFYRDGEKIRCLVGYIDIGTAFEACAAFIPEQITENGAMIEKETIFFEETNYYTPDEHIITKGA